MNISVSMITFYGETEHLHNAITSLYPLHPEEVCIVDTSRAPLDTRRHLYSWLDRECAFLDTQLHIEYREWDGCYRDAKNQALDMCTGDWTVMLDSDEMLTHQMARELREYLADLPDHALAVRVKRLSLLDDKRMLHSGQWPPFRPNRGQHPRIVRTGTGRYKGNRVHEVYQYPGRKTIPFHSPEHPKKDWRDHYLVHMWVYTDNVMRRRWGGALPLQQLPKPHEADPDEIWKAAQAILVKKRHWLVIPIPEGIATWYEPIWYVDPSDWIIKYDQEKGRWHYDSPYRHAQR